MPAKKKSVTTPLHLLEQLSRSLVEHLQKACDDAQKEPELLLAKLEKQRGKVQEKLVKTRARLDEAGNAGKSKAQAKARSKLAELDDMLALLQARQNETLSYLAELKRDAEKSLTLAQGVTKVGQAAVQALAARDKASAPVAKAPARPSARTAKPATKAAPAKPAAASTRSAAAATRARKPAAAPKPAAQPVADKPTATKAPAARPAASRAKPATAPKPAATRPAAAKKPATRKPAATPASES
ncbi:AlgP family protein [Stutzerimonas sp. NM35]